MASSRVMASSSPARSDLARQPSSQYSLSDAAKTLGSMSMEDLLRNIYAGDPAAAAAAEPDGGEAPVSRQGGLALASGIGNKSVDEVWRDIAVAAASGGGRNVDAASASADGGEITLEAFLAKAGAVVPQQLPPEVPIELYGDGAEGGGGGAGGGGGGGGARGRKRGAMDPEDRAALQRQKRMIKNRESAARSRERKQAYTVELESLVSQLEEENAELVRHQEETKKKRLKQLMENVIPVTESRKPPRSLRRTNSLEW